jgi:uncharacterized protein YkwD
MISAAAASVVLLATLGAPPAQLPALTPLEATALDRVRAALPQRTVPELSEPLVQAARALARSAAAGDPHPLSSTTLRAALGEAGVVDPAPAAVVLSARVSSLPDAIAAAAGFLGATHLGIGVVVQGELAWAVLLASEQRAELDPFPRRVASGSSAVLSGRLSRLDGPRAWVADPSGAAFEVPVEADGRRFRASIHFDRPGTWRVEVGGTGPRGATLAALLEVSCDEGGAPPSPASPEAGPEPSDPAVAGARIRAAANALRDRQGLRPLRATAALDEQARRHSEAMLAAGTVAHRLEDGRDLAARLAGSGVGFRSARENVARGDGALDAHRAVVESPAHLANLLAPDVELMGLGIARGALPGGQPVVYLTEILVEPRDPVPAGDPPTGKR